MQNFAQYFRGLSILFSAMLIGQVLVGLILWNFIPPMGTPDTNFSGLDNIFGLASLGAIVAAFIVSRKRIEAASREATLMDKLAAYRSALILRFALLEGSVMLCFVNFFFIHANYVLLALGAFTIFIFALQMPRKDTLIRDLALTEAEQAKLDDPNEMVAAAADTNNQ